MIRHHKRSVNCFVAGAFKAIQEFRLVVVKNTIVGTSFGNSVRQLFHLSQSQPPPSDVTPLYRLLVVIELFIVVDVYFLFCK